MPALHSIYALCEPQSQVVRYVGRTSRSAKTRHYEHVRLTMRLVRRDSKTKRAPVYGWIASLIESRQYPELIILTECPGDKSAEVEQAWIDAFSANGYDLLNAAPPRRSTRDSRQSKGVSVS